MRRIQPHKKASSFPQPLFEVLMEHLFSFYRRYEFSGQLSKKDLLYFAKGVERLSYSFTQDRQGLRANYLNDPVLRSGYLFYFLPVNWVKFEQLFSQHLKLDAKKNKIISLDLGCGPATASLALLYVLKQKGFSGKLVVHLVDHSKTILKDGSRLLENFAKRIGAKFDLSIHIHPSHLADSSLFSALAKTKFDLVFLGQVLNELKKLDLKWQFIANLIQKLTAITFFICEPALRVPTRDLQKIRDKLLDYFPIEILGPCLDAGLCPLNQAQTRDWCHFYMNWRYPEFLMRMDKILKLKKDFLALSYLVFQKSDQSASHQQSAPKNQWRVISNLMVSKGKKELVVCGALGRMRLTRLDREASQSNYDFHHAKRGDLILCEKLNSKREYDYEQRLAAKNSFKIIDL